MQKEKKIRSLLLIFIHFKNKDTTLFQIIMMYVVAKIKYIYYLMMTICRNDKTPIVFLGRLHPNISCYLATLYVFKDIQPS